MELYLLSLVSSENLLPSVISVIRLGYVVEWLDLHLGDSCSSSTELCSPLGKLGPVIPFQPDLPDRDVVRQRGGSWEDENHACCLELT